MAKSEPLSRPGSGTLYKLTKEEFDLIRAMIGGKAGPPQPPIISPDPPAPYTKKDALHDLFMEEEEFDKIIHALREKKNLILQGAPGVGKTYVAKRLAWALVGSKDAQCVETVQFHQSYAYEDFIQGFRPTDRGKFELKNGVFYRFCQRAMRPEARDRPHVFIIDEINRGNLSKIFGELMMLIEPDKRGADHGMSLTYSSNGDAKFHVPENVHLIGMMNTADRSLAMVDYALRRRFRFIDLKPEFHSKKFREFLLNAGASSDLVDKIAERMQGLNDKIAADKKNLGRGYQIGHSYFCPSNGMPLNDAWYRRVVEYEIIPLLREYWLDEKTAENHGSLLLQ